VSTRSGRGRRRSGGGRSTAGRRTRRCACSATRAPTASRSCPSWCNVHFVHHNFVVALLNDLFGIQSRGGCSCAGPYGHRLLGIDLDRSHEFEHEIAEGCEGIKPGWTRVSFNYFIDEPVFEYIVDAVDLVAAHGWKLLPEYRFDPATGLWRHRRGAVEPPLRLRDVSYDPSTGAMVRPPIAHDTAPDTALADHLAAARERLEAAPPWSADGEPLAALSAEFEHLRWFDLPAASLGGAAT
jgi:hypothetical protein